MCQRALSPVLEWSALAIEAARPLGAAAAMGLVLVALRGASLALVVAAGGAAYVVSLMLLGGLRADERAILWRIVAPARGAARGERSAGAVRGAEGVRS